jgi:hypothetical protein
MALETPGLRLFGGTLVCTRIGPICRAVGNRLVRRPVESEKEPR